MGASANPLTLMGAAGSPYTRKMIALLRYRRIAHAVIWSSHRNPPAGYPEPAVKLLPTFYFPKPDGGLQAVVDSTPILRRHILTSTDYELLDGPSEARDAAASSGGWLAART